MARKGSYGLGGGKLGRKDRGHHVHGVAPKAGKQAPKEDVRGKQGVAESTEMSSEQRRQDRPRIMFRVESELAERVKNTVFGLSGPPVCLTLEDLGADALTAQVKLLEQKHNKGKPFPKATRALRRGRGPA